MYNYTKYLQNKKFVQYELIVNYKEQHFRFSWTLQLVRHSSKIGTERFN